MKRNSLRENACKGIFQVSSYFQSNDELATMMEPFNWKFRDTYKQGFEAYKNGDWTMAKKQFEQA